MPKDKIVKNAWKDLAVRAGAQVKKLVESNESRSMWLPAYLAECKVKLGVTTEEPVFLPKAKRKSKKQTKDQLSAAELRRKSVLAAQQPLQDPLQEAALQDESEAEPRNNVIDETPLTEVELVAVPVSMAVDIDVSEDEEAFAHGLTGVVSTSEMDAAATTTYQESSVPEITLTELVSGHDVATPAVEPEVEDVGEDLDEDVFIQDLYAGPATTPLVTLQEGDETRDMFSPAVTEEVLERSNGEVEVDGESQEEREPQEEQESQEENELQEENEPQEHYKPQELIKPQEENEPHDEDEPQEHNKSQKRKKSLEQVAKSLSKTSRSSVKRPLGSSSSSEAEETSTRPVKKTKLVEQTPLARRTTTTITKIVTEEFVEPRATEAVEEADVFTARRVTFSTSGQPGGPVPEAGAGLEAPRTELEAPRTELEASSTTPVRVTRSRTKSRRRSSVSMSLSKASASRPALQNQSRSPMLQPKAKMAARTVAASPLVRDSGFQSGSAASSTNSQKVRSRLGVNQRAEAGPSNLMNTSGLKSFVPSRARTATVEDEEEQRAGERRRKGEREAEVAARKAKMMKDKADELKEKNEARQKKVREAKGKREVAVAMKEKRAEEANEKEAARKKKLKKVEERAAAEVVKSKKAAEEELARLKEAEEMEKAEEGNKVEAAKRREEDIAQRKAAIAEQKKAAREAARAAGEAREGPAPAAPDLNATYDKDDCKQAQAASSYDMTPARHELPPAPLVDQNNYGLEDLQSDEDTDDEENPRKEIPRWAEGSDLRTALLKQTYMCPDLDQLFDVIVNPNLGDMFSIIRKRFDKRTSSAVWDSTPGSFMHKRF